MKTKKQLAFIIIISLLAIFFSCETLGTVMPSGLIEQATGALAEIGQATGNLTPGQAAALKKAGVAVEKAYEEITPEQEYYIGRAVGANILSSYKLQAGKAAQLSYINKICNALVVNSPRPDIFNGYHLNILDSDEINAFATPGGHIFMTRGLINTATSEDTLASVIAHEIAHIQLQHGMMAIKKSRTNQAFASAAVSVATIAVGDKEYAELVNTFANGVGEIAITLMEKGYSRDQEFEADSMAMALLEMAGYEPSSLIDMLKVLEKNQGKHPGGFNSTHPSPAQRITNAQKKVGEFNVPDTRSHRAARFKAAM